MLLSDIDIRTLIEDKGFIEGYTDLEVQLQQCGFDLVLDYVEKARWGKDTAANMRWRKRTVIDFDNKRRVLTDMVRLQPLTDGARFEVWYGLPAGDYVFHTRERVRIPSDIGAILRVRSSLHRVGIGFTSSCIDPGYYGHLTASLHIPSPGLKIMRGARFCQMLSWRLESPASKSYEGVYKEKDKNG